MKFKNVLHIILSKSYKIISRLIKYELIST